VKNKMVFFYRQVNPVFFSLEKVFGNIAAELRRNYAAEFEVEEVKMPFVSRPSNLLKNIAFTARHQAEVNHITGDVHYAILGCSRQNAKVLTIHDCGATQKYRKTDPRYWVIKWLWFSWPVKRADAVTVISENTRKELLALTGMDSRKVWVIPNFVDPAFQPFARPFDTAKPRILFIGATPNKNLERLAAALSGLPVLLDVVGELNEGQVSALQKEHIRYEQSSRLSPEAALAKYQQCDLLAFPSLYEGFGLPVLEAQAVGRPVLTSRIPPLTEVSGGAACLIDPQDVDAIREGICRIIEDADYRKKIVEEGFANVLRFRLESVTAEYAALYRNVLRKKNLS
jgi:glycosyltransferase involved in cell wall biosynthesis